MPYAPPALSPDQAAEFPGAELGALALSWLEFQRSSPCTTKKTAWPYFTAPDENAMSEDDVLYGPDREAAHKKLIWSLRRCQRAGLLSRYFDPAHAQFYESATMPGFVLLKEWAAEQVPLPGLYTGSFRAIKPEDYDEVWLIVRSLKAMPKNPLGNIYHVPLLSPSKDLWLRHLALKKSGNWDKDTFMSLFAPQFLREMLQPEPYAKLREMHKKTRQQAVLCACYCSDEDLCHRSLIRMIQASMDS